MPKLIIFDLDGTLIDSQPWQYEAYNTVFTKYGAPLTREDWCQWITESWNAKIWSEKNNLDIDSEQIRAEKKIIYDRFVKENLEAKSGATDLIKLLSKEYPLCIASSSRIESIEEIVDKFVWRPYFQRLISDTGMMSRKPAPDVFLRAAELMNCEPGECLVIEDSLAGLKAAKAAGMECLICPDNFAPFLADNFAEADLIVDSLEELERIEEYIYAL